MKQVRPFFINACHLVKQCNGFARISFRIHLLRPTAKSFKRLRQVDILKNKSTTDDDLRPCFSSMKGGLQAHAAERTVYAALDVAFTCLPIADVFTMIPGLQQNLLLFGMLVRLHGSILLFAPLMYSSGSRSSRAWNNSVSRSGWEGWDECRRWDGRRCWPLDRQ